MLRIVMLQGRLVVLGMPEGAVLVTQQDVRDTLKQAKAEGWVVANVREREAVA